MGGGDADPATCMGGGNGGATEGQEHLMADVLGLVARSQYRGSHTDDPLVLTTKDLVQISPNDGARRVRHRHDHSLLARPGATGDRPGAARAVVVAPARRVRSMSLQHRDAAQ